MGIPVFGVEDGVIGMLTIYSTQGSPGASTMAIYMATFWAAAGREVLFVEADPSGGLLSLNLGIQFTPGSASFMASGLPVLGKNLIDHSQDVLFNHLHVMPAPPSPTGARDITEMYSEHAEELRTVSERDMAVIVDGGRITVEAMESGLTRQAAAVVIVVRGDSQLMGLEHLKGSLAGDHMLGGPKVCAVTIGKSPLSKDEWQTKCGLMLSGSIALASDITGDLSVFLTRNKRKFKKWNNSLQRVCDVLYPYAHPPVSETPLGLDNSPQQSGVVQQSDPPPPQQSEPQQSGVVQQSDPPPPQQPEPQQSGVVQQSDPPPPQQSDPQQSEPQQSGVVQQSDPPPPPQPESASTAV